MLKKRFTHHIKNCWKKRSFHLSKPNFFAPPGLRIFINGPPASGKGTQCSSIVEHTGVIHFQTGAIIRQAIEEESELGIEAKSFIEKGDLVPDEMVIGMVTTALEDDEVNEKGFLLDGFPRTSAQAEFLKSEGLLPDIVINIECPDEVVIERIEGRRFDPVTEEIYHLLYKPPPNDEDVMERLIQRADDTREVIEHRLEVFHENAELLKAFDNVINVNGNQEIEVVKNEIIGILDEL